MKKWFLILGLLVVVGVAMATSRRSFVQPMASAVSTYTASAVTYDGSNDFLGRTNDFTGAVDTKIILVSLWFKKAADGANVSLLLVGNSAGTLRFRIIISSGNILQIRGRNAAETFILQGDGDSTITGTDWHHLAVSFNIANTGERAVYLDGAAHSTTWTTYTDDTLDVAGTSYRTMVGAIGDGTLKWNGCLAEVWCSTLEASWFDITQASNLQKFRSAGGKPVSLGATGSTPTGTAPIFYLKGDNTNWEVNSAGTGDFVVNGSFDTCTAP